MNSRVCLLGEMQYLPKQCCSWVHHLAFSCRHAFQGLFALLTQCARCCHLFFACREERKARRRRKKQAGASNARAAAGAGDKAVAGRKSLRAAQDAGILNKGVPKKHGRTVVGSSSAVFAKIQAQRDIAAAGGAAKPSGRKGEGEAGASNVKGSALKL